MIEWVSVRERLPELTNIDFEYKGDKNLSSNFVVVLAEGSPYIGWLSKDFDCDQEWHIESDDSDPTLITHWHEIKPYIQLSKT